MSFASSFTTYQVLGAPANAVFNDTSSGSDGAIVSRRIYIKDSSGSFLVPTGISTQYNVWSIATNPLTIVGVFLKDEAVTIVVQWLDVSNNVLYDSTQIVGYTLFNETFDYTTTQAMAGNPTLINDNNWFYYKSLVRTFIDSGNQAISFASDVYNAQLCYQAATDIRTKKQYLFNINS